MTHPFPSVFGRPMVNGAKGLDIADGMAKVRRDSEAGVEIHLTI